MLAAKARAVLHGRYYVSTEDIRAVAAPVLRHRIMTNFNAEAEGIKPDDIVQPLDRHHSRPTTQRPAPVENYRKYLDPQTLAKLHGPGAAGPADRRRLRGGRASQPVPRLLGRVRRAPRVRRRATTCATSTGRSSARPTSSTSSSTRKRRTSSATCCSTPARACAIKSRERAAVEAGVRPVRRRRRWRTWSCSSRTASAWRRSTARFARWCGRAAIRRT